MLFSIPEELKALDRASTAEDSLMLTTKNQKDNDQVQLTTLNFLNKKLQAKLKTMKKENQLHIKQLELKEIELEKIRTKMMDGLAQYTEMIDELTIQVNVLEKENCRLKRQLDAISYQQSMALSQTIEANKKNKQGFFSKVFRSSQKGSSKKEEYDDPKNIFLVKNTTSSDKIDKVDG